MSTNRSELTRESVRVVLDATGMGTLTPEVDAELVELARAAGRVGDNLVVVCKPRDAKLFKSFGLDVHRAPDLVRSERPRRLWIDWGFPRLARSLGAGVIHSPHDVFPVLTRLRRVVAVRQSNGLGDRTHRLIGALRLDVTAPSTAVAEDVRDSSGLPANRVHIAPVGVDKDRTAIPEWQAVEEVADLYGVSDWIAFLADESDPDTIASFRDGFRRATEFSERRPALIVLGLPETSAVAHFAELVNAGFDVRIVSDLADSERSALLGGSQFTVVIDESRQTGRALLDAMACGATVLSRRTSTLTEIGGEAVEFVDDSPAAVEIAVTALLNNPDHRRRLASAAVTRSHDFSWEASLAAHRVAWNRASLRR